MIDCVSKRWILLLLFVLSQTSHGHDEDAHTLRYTHDNFSIEVGKKNHFVMFYAPCFLKKKIVSKLIKKFTKNFFIQENMMYIVNAHKNKILYSHRYEIAVNLQFLTPAPNGGGKYILGGLPLPSEGWQSNQTFVFWMDLNPEIFGIESSHTITSLTL
ncbi:hypothetical protein ALC53_09008 [Atta colombica]|uniref:Uncharacterized protein n=1 Tax=Atta colombica TaxID=520822 RepID=A0A195B7G0_9HYME|nr:hypothetical protein ALC53_09008 [Atta colombica]